VQNRQQTSGLLYDQEQAAIVRFRLQQGLAHSSSSSQRHAGRRKSPPDAWPRSLKHHQNERSPVSRAQRPIRHSERRKQEQSLAPSNLDLRRSTMYAPTKRTSAAVFISTTLAAVLLVILLSRFGPEWSWLAPLVLGMALLAYLDGRFSRTE
jgi:hypothetical protein